MFTGDRMDQPAALGAHHVCWGQHSSMMMFDSHLLLIGRPCYHAGGEPVEIKAGDLCTFPAGMSCTWDVKKAINKHYDFSN